MFISNKTKARAVEAYSKAYPYNYKLEITAKSDKACDYMKHNKVREKRLETLFRHRPLCRTPNS